MINLHESMGPGWHRTRDPWICSQTHNCSHADTLPIALRGPANIPCGSRVMTISLKDLDRPKWCSSYPCHRFAYQWLDNIKINKYAKFDPNIQCGSWVMSIFTIWPQQAGLMLSKLLSIKRWFRNVDMHMYANFYQNIPWGRTDSH